MDQIDFELKIKLLAGDVCELEKLLKGTDFEFITDEFYKQIEEQCK